MSSSLVQTNRAVYAVIRDQHAVTVHPVPIQPFAVVVEIRASGTDQCRTSTEQTPMA